jgi:hypothetical protein
LISAGLYGWPVDDAIRAALGVCWPGSERLAIRLVLFGQREFDLAQTIANNHDF